jgi:phenylalanyl-tRNA synthetase beta chain
LGWLGELHPLALEAFAVQGTVVAFELETKALLATARPARDFVPIPQFPAVQLDIAIVVSEETGAEKVCQVIRSAAGSLLEDVRLFDVYRDAQKLGEGRKSLALALQYRAADRTLTSDEVEKLHDKVLRKLSAATGGELRV